MTRETLTRQIHQLQDEILLLGSMVEQAMLTAVDALKRRDGVVAKKIYSDDRLINEKRFAIENAVLITIATQQPMARDLRFIAAVLVIAIELERMGDYARGIAEIVVRMGYQPPVKPLIDLPHMAEMARAMLRDALDAYVQRDVAAAKALPARDDAVDALNDRIYHELIDIMIRHPDTVARATYLLWITHNIERMADRVTNIAERIVFMVTGELVEMDVSSY